MKIFRSHWDPTRKENVDDLVLSVIKETKTQLVAIDRRHPRAQYRFRKPDVLRPGTQLRPVGKQEKFPMYHYELYLESGAI